MILFTAEGLSDVERVRSFLDARDQAAAKRALAAIWAALERVERFPALGRPTEDPDIRQVVIRFGDAGYIVRYSVLTEDQSVLVMRIWQGREARK